LVRGWGFFSKKQEDVTRLREMLLTLNSLSMNLTRYSEVKGREPNAGKEPDLRLSMSLSDLRDFQRRLEGLNEGSLPPVVARALNVMSSYAVIASVEGLGFVSTNLDAIARSTRWAISSLEQAVRG